MKYTQQHREDKHAKSTVNWYLLDELIENVRTAYYHTDKYGILDKVGQQALKDAKQTAYDIDRSDQTEHYDTTFWNE